MKLIKIERTIIVTISTIVNNNYNDNHNNNDENNHNYHDNNKLITIITIAIIIMIIIIIDQKFNANNCKNSNVDDVCYYSDKNNLKINSVIVILREIY